MRTRLAVIPVLAGALLLGACSDSGDSSDDAASPTPTPTSTTAPTEGGTAAGTPQPETVSADLPEGVVATVGDTEIQLETLDQRLEVIREIPDVASQLEGDNAAQVEDQLRRQALGQLVLQEAVIQGAAREDVTISDQQVEERRSEMAEEAGGEEAFLEQLATAGVPEGQVGQQVRSIIAFEVVTEQLLADAGADPSAPATEGASPTATEGGTAPSSDQAQAQQVQRNWLSELLQTTDVVVDEEVGAWNATSGQVVPA